MRRARKSLPFLDDRKIMAVSLIDWFRLRTTASDGAGPSPVILGPKRWLRWSQLIGAAVANIAVPAAVSDGRFFLFEPVLATMLLIASLLLASVAILVGRQCRS